MVRIEYDTPYKIFLASILLASKYIDDSSFVTKTIHKTIAPLYSSREVADMERSFLSVVKVIMPWSFYALWLPHLQSARCYTKAYSLFLCNSLTFTLTWHMSQVMFKITYTILFIYPLSHHHHHSPLCAFSSLLYPASLDYPLFSPAFFVSIPSLND